MHGTFKSANDFRFQTHRPMYDILNPKLIVISTSRSYFSFHKVAPCVNFFIAAPKAGDMSQSTDSTFIPDLPKGPLCRYRCRAKFDWKQLKIIFEREQDLRIKVSGFTLYS